MQDGTFEIDGPVLKFCPGDGIAIVIGDKTYRGTLFEDGGRWCVKVIGDGDEVEIHKL